MGRSVDDLNNSSYAWPKNDREVVTIAADESRPIMQLLLSAGQPAVNKCPRKELRDFLRQAVAHPKPVPTVAAFGGWPAASSGRSE